MRDHNIRIDGERFSAHLDSQGNFQKIVFMEEVFEPPLRNTLYEINDEMAYVSEVRSEKELYLKLATKATSGRLTISSGKEIKIHLEADQKDVAKKAGLVVSFPLETVFHLSEDYNLGRKIDSEMPVGEQYSTNLGYNFFLANVDNMWIRLMTRQMNTFQRRRSASVHISRHPEIFIVTFTWNVTDDAYLAVFSSMDEAIEDFESWLKNELGVRKLSERPNIPEWVHNVKLVLTMDMMRPNWEIAHDYNDIANLAGELKEIGCPKDTLFYLPGYNGAYDSTYPNYEPHPELGGEEKFREMIETLHKNGFRAMIHTNAWGLDPCHPDIDRLQKHVLKDSEGNYKGFQTGGFFYQQRAPPQRPLKYLTDKIPFKGPKGARSLTFETTSIPDRCEALITIGGTKVGDARVRITIGRRSVLTPPGWFKDHQEYDIPIGFPFLLEAGKNKIKLEVVGEAQLDWSEGWYKIRHCYIPLNPYTSWTYPILFANTSDLEWIKVYVENVASVVMKYGIDALHIDATEYEWRKDICLKLREKLPDAAISGEGFATLSAMGFWAFAQMGVGQSLLAHLDIMRGTVQQGSLPDTSDLEELYRWLNKPSPVNNFVKDYVKTYTHLCAADAFVPIGKVCNTFPTRYSPRCKRELWKVIREAHGINYVPALRLNYRKYGLDEDAKKAIREIASW